jgi:glyoxylase I family protein
MSQDWEVQSLFHFVLNVTNLERSLEFYQRLGFRVLRDNRDVVWPPMVAENFGMKVAQGRGALLGLGEGPDHTRLDLIEWLEPRWSGAGPSGAASAPAGGPAGEPIPRILALRTRNVRAAWAELSKLGIEFIREPRDPNPTVGVESVVCCRDPDGTVVELIEYMGDRLGSRIDLLERRS